MMGPWENPKEELLTQPLDSPLGVFGTFVTPYLGLVASSSSLGDTVGVDLLQIWGVFVLTP